MKYLYVLLFVSVGLLCCACGINSAKNGSTKPQGTVYSEELVQLPPQTEFTLGELASQTADFRDHVVDSYQQMLEAAVSDNAYETGKALAKAVEEQYGARISELADMDFTGMTEDELTKYMLELTSLTTAIREAKDALTLG